MTEPVELRQIKVTLIIELPSNIKANDIKQWVDVNYGECSSMKSDNPCKETYEVIEHDWEYTQPV